MNSPQKFRPLTLSRLTLALLLAAGLPLAQAQTAPAPVAPAPTTPTAPIQPAPAQTAPAQATPSPAQPAPATTRPKIPASNYVIIGNTYYGQGKYDDAYVAFKAAVELEPLNADALLGLGRSQVKLRLFAPALETLRSLTKVAPKNLSGFLALAQAYQQEYMLSPNRSAIAKNLDTALNVLQDAEAVVKANAGTEQNTQMSSVLNERGNVYRLKGEAGKAIDSYRQATALNPNNSLILFNLGDMYSAVGDLSQAISTLQQAVIIDPRDAYNRAYYAKLLALSGNLANARAEAAQAAKMAPITPVTQSNGTVVYLAKDPAASYAAGQYGVVSYLSKDPATARTQLTLATKVDALRYPEFYYYLGRLALDESDVQGARQNLTKAAALGSNIPEYAYYLGLSYERGAGVIAPDKVKARENYQRALQLNPNYQNAKDALKRVQ